MSITHANLEKSVVDKSTVYLEYFHFAPYETTIDSYILNSEVLDSDFNRTEADEEVLYGCHEFAQYWATQAVLLFASDYYEVYSYEMGQCLGNG